MCIHLAQEMTEWGGCVYLSAATDERQPPAAPDELRLYALITPDGTEGTRTAVHPNFGI
jgi:hypothetical protein